MKKRLLTGCLWMLLFNTGIFAQLNVKVQVEKISVLNTADCDAGGSDNSDFLFEYKATDNSPSTFSNNVPVAGSIGMCNYAYVNENNGPFAIFTATPGLAVFSPTNGVFFNRSYNCIQDVPTTLNLVWRGYENDDAASPSLTPIASGITALNSTIVNLPAQATPTVQAITYTATSSGACTQTYEITFKITVSTGTFAPLQITNVDAAVICNGANNGHLEVYTSGGSGTVLYDWSNDALNDFDDASSVAGLSVGIYTITIKDGINCTHTATTSVTSIAPPIALGSFVTSSPTVCAGQSNVAYSVASQTTPAVYNWNFTGVGGSINGSTNAVTLNFSNTAQSGTLSVYAQNSCSISPTRTMVVTVTPKPVVGISGVTSMCDNVQSVLTATGATTYTWSTGAISPGITVTPTSTTVYTVSGTMNNCNGVSNQFTMTVLPSPTVQVTGTSATVCPNNTVSVSSSGSGTIFVWSDGFIGATHVISAPVTTTYTISNILNSCIKQATYTLNVHPLPVLSVSGNTIVCPGKTLTLTASGANTYSWSTGSNNASITYTPTGLVTLTVTGANTITGCVNSTTVSAGSYAAGLVSITGNTAICNTLQGVLTANGSYFYLWNNGATANTNTISPTGPTTVSVVGTTLDGCKDSASVAIMVINNLSIAISGPDSICFGQSALLNAGVSGATTYSWNTGAISPNITVSPTTTFTYIVTASNPGCSGTKQHQLFVKSLPVVDFNVTTPLCAEAGTYSLSATPSGGVYLGSGVAGNTFNPSIGIGSYPVTYQVTGSNGCSASATKTIEVLSCVGISEQEAERFLSLFPNPSNGKVTLMSGVSFRSVTVFDYTGKLIRQFEDASVQQAEIDLSELTSGVYTFVIISSDKGSEAIKVVKN
jgi:hypothetical protein